MKTWHKVAAVSILVLAGAYVVMFANIGLPSFVASTGSAQAKKAKIEELRTDLALAMKTNHELSESLNETAALATHFYPAGTTSNVIQKEVEQIAFRTGLNYSVLRSVSARLDEEALIHYEEVNISGNVDYMNLVKFLREIDNHDPLLLWTNCTISPRRRADQANVVFVSGRIRALVLSDRAAAILAGEEVDPL